MQSVEGPYRAESAADRFLSADPGGSAFKEDELRLRGSATRSPKYHHGSDLSLKRELATENDERSLRLKPAGSSIWQSPSEALAGTSATSGIDSKENRPVFKMRRTGQAGPLKVSPSRQRLNVAGGISTQFEAPHVQSACLEPELDPPIPLGDQEPAPAMIGSDIVKPTSSLTFPIGGNEISNDIASRPSSSSGQSELNTVQAKNAGNGKKQISQPRRDEISRHMKELWATGKMAHVHDKRKEALKKRKASEGSLSDGPDSKMRAKKDPTKIHLAADVRASSGSLSGYNGTKEQDPEPQPSSTQGLLQHPTSSDRNAKAMWSYIRPYLAKHQDIKQPHTGLIRRLLSLPRIRHILFNESFIQNEPYYDSTMDDISSLILQVTGDEAAQPCERCQSGDGPFEGCVMVSLAASRRAKAAVHSCANCFYHGNESSCSHKAWARNRNARRYPSHNVISDGTETETDVLLEEYVDGTSEQDADLDDGDSVDREAELGSPPTVGKNDEVREARSSTQQSEALLPKPSAIETSETGRLYTMWYNERFDLVYMNGMLFPDAYRIDLSVKSRPWICPIDTCRRLCCKSTDLAYHFSRTHYAALLNDNGDGTLTVTGIYDRKPNVGSGQIRTVKSPPIIVSRTPREGTDYQIAAPSLPEYLQKPVSHKKPTPPKLHSAKSADPEGRDAQTQLVAGDAMALWNYIKPHLVKTTSIPTSGWVKELLPLPRVRDITWNPLHLRRFIEYIPRDISAMIVQVTGEEPPTPCNRCNSGLGPFEGCVAISREAPGEVRARFVSCANCNYHNHQRDCSLIHWVISREQTPYQGTGIGTGFSALSSVTDDSAPSSIDAAKALPQSSALTSVAKDGSDPVVRRRSERLFLCETRPSESIEGRLSGSTGSSRQSSMPKPEAVTSQLQMSKREGQQDKLTASNSALVATGQLRSAADMLEMEDWEIAPGRIHAEASDTPDNIAMSKAYLTNNRTVQVSEDLSFRVDTIISGSTLQLEPEAGRTRVCSVAVGKVRVRVEGEAEFAIGPHGLFKVRPGASCTVQNRLYLDAVVHIMSITE